MTTTPKANGGFLNLIEAVGNKLPDPATLFFLGTILVMLVSHLAHLGGWQIEKELPVKVTQEVTQADGTVTVEDVLDENGDAVLEWEPQDEHFKATSLLTRDGFFWAIKSLVDNFVNFPPLGVVLVGMLGIGIAERTGLFAAIMKAIMLVVPGSLLTPMIVFVGIMSSMTLDAGYVVLPPLAAVLYISVGRSPLVGIAAAFAGVSAGFNANLFITGLDPLLAGFATTGAQVIDPNYTVSAAANWGFMAASTVVMTLTGWGVTSIFVEKRLNTKSPEDGGPIPQSDAHVGDHHLKDDEKRGMVVAFIAFLGVAAVALALILVPNAPLNSYQISTQNELDHPGLVAGLPAELLDDPYGEFRAADGPTFANENGTALTTSTEHFDRWVTVIVPLLFFLFLIPAIVYGISVGNIKNDKDVAKLLMKSMAAMAPIIVLAFFAAQFTAYFAHSGLDKMLALWGGQGLGKAGLSPYTLLVAFILVTVVFNLFVGSMSAKYALFAPIFIPMFMLVGISPELTQVAYRIGDSTSNIITPLNAYLVIMLVFVQKYVPRGGMGTLISTMLPYTVIFTIVWTIMLLIWVALGIPVGPDAPLWYDPVAASAAVGG